MNAVQSNVRADVGAAIARASQATGVDFSYLLAQARIESGLNPAARAATSSAAGLYQFTSATWLQTLARHGAEHGLGWAQQAALGGDAASRAQAMALRFDPGASAAMAAELAGDNAEALRGALGREPDAAELYLAHFLGADGAGRFLSALSTDPSQSAAALLPKAAGANRAIFFAESGAPRSLGEVMGLIRTKVAGAMDQDTSLAPLAAGWASNGLPGVNAGFSPSVPAGVAPASHRPTMAETLAATFGGAAAAPAHVRAAYGQLKALGL
ncbi:MAG: transglycosylase SLT domain-containing protein [Proteobacteria bacterium]|nr:transglycosylase SLT domain-containing protein [Pseudomonadota bacterium]